MVGEVLQEDPEDLNDAVGENLDKEKGHGYDPAPASVRGLPVDVCGHAAAQSGYRSLHGPLVTSCMRAAKVNTQVVVEKRSRRQQRHQGSRFT